MTYEEALAQLYAALPAFHRVGAAALKPGLGNTLALLKRLGNPHLGFKTVHVAGTNGKGSSSHMLAAIFQSAGYKTGLYTSPHLHDYRERIRIDGAMIPQQRVVDFVAKEWHLISDEVEPSFFEVTVALCFQFFKEEAVDIAIIETGLGGRLDSTNVIQPELSLITNIGYDHMELLGPTLPLIASEKAGIIKAQTLLVVSEKQVETQQVFIEKALEQDAELVFASEAWKGDWLGETSTFSRVTGETFRFTPSLTGTYQAKNVAGVLEAVFQLRKVGWKISDKAIIAGLENVQRLTGLAGRWQIIRTNPLVVADTAHNAEGLDYVFKQAEQAAGKAKLTIILGTVLDKDLGNIFPLLPRQADYIFSEPSVFRKRKAEDLAAAVEQGTGLKGKIMPNVNIALATALALAGQNDVILITGSNFLVADLPFSA